jgi:regulatory protein
MTGENGRPATTAKQPRGRGRAAGRAGQGSRLGAGQSGAGARSRAEIAGHPEDELGDPESVARAICLRLLAGQPRTRSELAAALARRGVPAEAAERVLGRFAEVGLIDDRAFAEAWVDSRHVGRGLGRRALVAELRRRGIDDLTATEAVATLDPGTEEATARALVRRRLGTGIDLAPAVRARRAVAMLARRGYPAELALRLVREEFAGHDEVVDSVVDVETD